MILCIPAEVDELKERYRAGRVGDVEVKKRLAAAINRFLDTMRERRAKYESKPEFVREMLAAGREHAHKLGARLSRWRMRRWE